MIQVRCPGCGYLQSLSEERFLSITDDFLDCPHCHERVPKEWAPVTGESVPEEARHKMLAFSRRILNGGEITLEIVHALESQVRRYGPIQDSAKALGLGYTCLGEKNKAEELWQRARKEAPYDAEVLHSLLDVFFSREKFTQAIDVGRTLLDTLGPRADDEDVGRLALAYIAENKIEEAEKLLEDSNLDPRNSFVKQARKRLNKTAGGGLRSLFGESNPLHRLFGGSGKEGLKSITHKAGNLIRRSGEPQSAVSKPVHESVELKAGIAVLEYWIYTPDTSTPQWDDIQRLLGDSISEKAEREHTFDLLETLVEENDLTIDYILRSEGNELFDYPEELIPQNAGEFSEEDKRSLLEARMIVRLRLSVDDPAGIDYVFFMMRFAEAVRSLTGGVVQDAVSHALWGMEEWKQRAASPREAIVDAHIRCDLLDEGGLVWIHTHGIQKFGFPELEMEGIPSDSASAGRALILTVAETLIRSRERGRGIHWPMPVSGTSVMLTMEALPKDDEEHFPIGSLKITPCIDGDGLPDQETLKRILSDLQSRPAPHAAIARRSEPSSAQGVTTGPRLSARKAALQEKLLKAHRQARESLEVFKKSFQQTRHSGGAVHAVKIGFPAQGGVHEWMWVSLDAWRGRSLVGYLENTPVLRKDLVKGSRVQISEGEIFDWVITRAGTVIDGAYTEEIL
jgi:uncharacterized protein YegJ (DUF2314 family)/tetratricopeptide (TPR) repeat protein